MSVFTKSENDDMTYMHEVDVAMHRRGHPWAFTLSASVLLFFVVIYFWADHAMIDDVTRGTGQIIPAQGVQPIQSERGGTITDEMVTENSSVERNQVLLTISSVREEAGLTDLKTKAAELTLSLKRLGAEADGRELTFTDEERAANPDAVAAQTRMYLTRKEQYDGQYQLLVSQSDQRKKEVSEARERKQTYENNLAGLREQEVIFRRMRGTGVTEIQYLDLKQRIVTQEGELNSVAQTIARAESGVQAAQERLHNLGAELRAKIADEINKSRTDLNAILEQIKAGSAQVTQTELRSPVRGTVKRIILKAGSVAKPAETIMEIIPTDGTLEVEARFSPQDRGFLFVNQPAMVKVTAYEFSIYGGLEATVTKISNDTIEDKKGEPWYEVRFMTKRRSILYRGEELEILPGMTVSVDVLTDKKSVLSHIIGPVRRAMENAMTEH